MFKILVLQALYNLSDDQAEFMINDRLTFKRFLGLGLADKAPIALFVRTIGIARAKTKIGMDNLVYNMRRLVWWDGRTSPA
ncbi:transposase [Magnetospirillum fulvum]|uniref:Transposase, IS4 n=1 Tax=Magnetospirillum fulvum MGU-K5 TaxID=1316936 RepID=S9SBG6_MAGFU|nr:Transposase, IS4 [Magnetospirillum fulvum MGU-K5]